MSASSSFSYKFNYNNNINIYDKTSYSNNLFKSKHNKKSLEIIIHQKFVNKYRFMPNNYNLNIIDNIIYNDKTHIVSMFKEYLIIDDKGDFLKRYYNKYESYLRLPKFFEFYELYSKIFPNYTCIEEGKYFYKNIQQKQRKINTIEKNELEKKIKKNNFIQINNNESENKNSDEKIFCTNVIDSLLNETNEEGINMLFNIDKNNIKLDDINFNKEVCNLIDEINKFKLNNEINMDKNNNKNNNNIINLIKNNNNKTSTKIKNDNNINKNNDIINSKKNIKLNSIAKFFSNINKSKNKIEKNKNLLNLYNNNYIKINLHHKHISKNNNLSKLNSMTDRTILDKLEQNYNKIRKKYSKNFSQNMSTSMKTKKDISSSRKNISIHSINYNSISTSYIGILNNFNHRLTHLVTSKGSNKDIKKEENNIIKPYINSRNSGFNFSSNIINNKRKINNSTNNKHFQKGNNTVSNNFKINSSTNKSFKNINIKKINPIKGHSKDSRNKKLSKYNINYSKIKPNKIGNILSHTNSILNYNDTKNNSKSKSKSKNKNKVINNYSNSFFDFNNKTNNKDIRYKKIENKENLIKQKILSNGFKIFNGSRNKKDVLSKKSSSINPTNSKGKNTSSKKDSMIKIGINDTLNKQTKNKIKNIKINNFSKIFSAFINQYNNQRKIKPKTERNKVIN